MTMRNTLLAGSAVALLGFGAASAAVLRPYSQISGGTVRLGDLFDELGSTPDRALGRAPAPGGRIQVAAPQLAAIARDFGVDWRPATGAEQVVIERRGEMLARSAVIAALRAALVAQGAPDGAEIAMPDFQPVMIPAGASLAPEITQCSYEPSGGRFTAMVSVASADMPPVQMRVSGAVLVLADATVPTHRLQRGAVVAEEDVQATRVRIGLLHGNASVPLALAVGMVLKHDVAQGAPLTAMDIVRPDLVERGALVHMTLSSEGIELAAEGIAKESGARGARVHVENPLSHAVVVAEVTGPGEVRVAPHEAVLSLAVAQ